MEGRHKPARSVLERLSWGSSSVAGKDEIVATADGLAGIIFMCNKKTKRRCLLHGVFGLPETRQDLVVQVVPGMKLFLFEYESRALFGIFESTSYGAIDLEPHAFLGQESSFPAQVYFQEVAKCVPLLEREFKAAIHENYYTPVKFSLDLSVDQVIKLIQLFQQVTSNAKGIHSVSQKVYPYASGGELPDRACEESSNLKKVTHDKTMNLDKTARAVSTVGKSPVHTRDERIGDSQSVQALLEIELRNNFLKRISGNNEISSQNFHPGRSTTFMDERASQYVYPLSRDSALYRAEDLCVKPHDSKYPVVGHEIWSDGVVLPKSFRTHSEQHNFCKDPLSTRIQAPSVLPYGGGQHDFRVDPLAAKVQGLNFSHIKDISATPNGTREGGPCVLANTNTSSFLRATPKGHGVSADLGAAVRPKLDSFDSKTIYSRAGNYTHYDRVQLDGHLSVANASVSKDHRCPQSSQRPFGDASLNESMDIPSLVSLVSKLPLYGQQGPDAAGGPRSQSMNNEFTERAHPCDGHSFKVSSTIEPGGCNSVVPRGSVESNERNTCKNEYSHGLIRDVNPALLGYGVQNLLTSEAAKISGSDTLVHNSMLSTLYGGHNSQSSDDSDLKRIYQLVEGLLLRKDTEDHSRQENIGNSLTSKTHVKTPSAEAHPSRGGSDSCDYGDHAIAWDKTDKKHKQSVWSRLSVLNGHEVDRNSHVAERRDVEAHSFCTSNFFKGNRLKPVRYSHPQANMEIFAKDVTKDSCDLHNEDTFTVNFKRRKGRNVTLKDEAACTKMPALQGSSQLEKDKKNSSDAIAQNLPNSLFKRRKLINEDTFTVNFKRRKGRNVTLKDEAACTKMPALQGSSQLEKDKKNSSDAIAQNLPNSLSKRRKLIRPEIHDVSEE